MRRLLIALLVSSSIALHAQSDRIYLNNGSVIKGTIGHDTLSDTVFINVSQKTIAIPLSIVDEVRFQRRGGVRPERYSDLIYQKGFVTALEMGVLIGDHNSYAPAFRPALGLSQEYHYHPFLNGGITVGMYHYERYKTFPITLNYQALLGNRYRSWLIYGKAGYAFTQARQEPEDLDISGGITFQAGIGWQQRIDVNALQIRFGYASQAIEEKQEFGPTYYVTRKRYMNRVTFTAVYLFKY